MARRAFCLYTPLVITPKSSIRTFTPLWLMEEKYNLEELERTLQGKTEEFISEYLADVIAKTTGEDFHKFFHQAAVFRQPVESSAYELFGTR